MKNYVWALYGAVLLSLVILGAALAFTTGNGSPVIILSLAFSIAYLVGLYGYVQKKPILTHKRWRVLFYINVLGLSLSLISFLLAPRVELAVDFVFKTLISIPLLIALYRYSSPDNEVWSNSDLANKIDYIAKAFEQGQKISANSFGLGASILITLESIKGEFNANIEKGSDENIQKFSNSFTDIEALIRFVESNTDADIYMPSNQLHNKSMLHKPLRGLDGFPLVPRYKPPQILGVMSNL